MATQTNQTDFPSLEDFEALLAEFSTETTLVQENEIATGRVLEVGADYVLVDIGFKSEGRIPIDEFKDAHGQVQVAAGDDKAVNSLEELEQVDRHYSAFHN